MQCSTMPVTDSEEPENVQIAPIKLKLPIVENLWAGRMQYSSRF